VVGSAQCGSLPPPAASKSGAVSRSYTGQGGASHVRLASVVRMWGLYEHPAAPPLAITVDCASTAVQPHKRGIVRQEPCGRSGELPIYFTLRL